MIIGLTGGIASGKTVVAGFFRNCGLHVVDADCIAHNVMVQGKEGWRRVVDAFGESILCVDQQIDREQLGKIIFADSQKRLLLNSLIHPLVQEEMEKEKNEVLKQASMVMLSIPLLIEVGMADQFDRIILAYAKPEIQLERLMKRDSLSLEEARLRLLSQKPIVEKKAFADIIIYTEKSLKAVGKDVDCIYQKLLQGVGK